MKKSVILGIMLISSFLSTAYAGNCYTSSVNVVFDNEGLSVDVPGLVCIKSLVATNVSRYSGDVTADLLVGTTPKLTSNRIDSVTYAGNGQQVIVFTVLSEVDGYGCSNGVGFDIKIKAVFNTDGSLAKIEELYGSAFTTKDTCHGPIDYIDLNYETVNYNRD